MPMLDLREPARDFAHTMRYASREHGDSHTFYNMFFEIFGQTRQDCAVYEMHVTNLKGNTAFIDLFWPGVFLVEQKSTGRDLDAALVQAEEYYINLEQWEKPHYLLACDFQTWRFVDLDEDKTYDFTLAELPDYIHLFKFMRRDAEIREPSAPVDVKAANMMAELHDSLKANGYGEDMEYLLTRITFCLFADHVNIFPPGAFEAYLNENKLPGAVETGRKMVELFDVLDTPDRQRQTNLSPTLKQFPYINGDLFGHVIRPPAFNMDARKMLLSAARYDWGKISPAIFGSLFQSTMDGAERRRTGAHYTAEENIMKIIRPLFLDDLEAEFEKISAQVNNGAALRRFQEKLGKLTFFDPACGAGNFLIMAYKELRLLEMKVLRQLHDGQQLMDVSVLSKIDVDQFYGIENNKFSARIAEVAMWMMDHLMNNELGRRFGISCPRIPIKKSPNIVCADALETEWKSVLDPDMCSYILGNPPFRGSAIMTAGQKRQIGRICGSTTIDYVCAWFKKAAEYVADSFIKIGFVATNSITQGAQVWELWHALEPHDVEIIFAYDSFKWHSNTKKKANVYVVIIGLCKKGRTPTKRLFYKDYEEQPNSISPYLFGTDKEIVIVKRSAKPINGLSAFSWGMMPVDGGNYIFTRNKKNEFLKIEPRAEKYMREYIGAREYINGTSRYFLAVHDIKPNEWRYMPHAKELVKKVRAFRQASTKFATRQSAKTPTAYNLTAIPQAPYILAPLHTSEKREYLPFGYLQPAAIPSKAVSIIKQANLGLFGLLHSRMHMVWLQHVGGKIKNDYRYSIQIVYNTFPVPKGDLDVLKPYAQAVLDIRASYPDSTPNDLYDHFTMKPDLRKAHEVLDKKVELMYRKKSFNDNMERLEFLLEKYGEVIRHR